MSTATLTTTFPLWPAGAPGALGTTEADIPALTVYTPDAAIATGASIVVCPGGGYGGLAVDHEGRQIAAWLLQRGIAAFVLRYRLGPQYHHPIELGDAQRAIRTVRAQATTWGVDPQRIGIWGFSAGGHLASTTGTHFDAGDPSHADPIERVSCRPDLMILSYPVITLKPPYAHDGSRINLLGEAADAALVDFLCNETQVTPDTPPTFLFHTTDDNAVPVENSLFFFQALRRNGVAAEIHIYAHGPHGVGLADGKSYAPDDPVLHTWTDRLNDWLSAQGYVKTR